MCGEENGGEGYMMGTKKRRERGNNIFACRERGEGQFLM